MFGHYRPGLGGRHALLIAAVASAACASSPRVQEIEARSEAFHRCRGTAPYVGIHWRFQNAETNSSDRVRTVEVWPGDEGWRLLSPPPESELSKSYAWLSPPSTRTRHEAFRAQAGLGMPSAGDDADQVLIFMEGGHYVEKRQSTVAVRHVDGRWDIDSVKRDRSGERLQTDQWSLTGDDALSLDALLADACLYAEPRNSQHSDMQSNANYRWTIEIVRDGRSTVFYGVHGGFGRLSVLLHRLGRAHAL